MCLKLRCTVLMSWLCFIHGLIGVRVNSGFIEFNGRFGVLKGLPDCTILHSGSSHFHRMSEPVCRQCEVMLTRFWSFMLHIVLHVRASFPVVRSYVNPILEFYVIFCLACQSQFAGSAK